MTHDFINEQWKKAGVPDLADTVPQVTQSETIIWHKYFDEKPNISGEYLIHDGHGTTVAYWSQPKRRFSGKKKIMSNGQDQHRVLWNIIAWSEKPKGWLP